MLTSFCHHYGNYFIEEASSLRGLYTLSLFVVFLFVGLWSFAGLVTYDSQQAVLHPGMSQRDYFVNMLSSNPASYILFVCVVGCIWIIVSEIRRYIRKYKGNR
jgi:uncharacterized membrane protein